MPNSCLFIFLGHCRMVIVYIVQYWTVFLVKIIIWMSYVGLHSLSYMRMPNYSNFNSIFSCCLSQKSFNSFISADIVKSVKDESIYNLKNGQYCSFLCILALSTINKLITFIQVLDRKSIDCYLIILLNHVSVILL